MNVACQNLEALTASFKYVQDIGRFGSLQSANYTDMLKRAAAAAGRRVPGPAARPV